MNESNPFTTTDANTIVTFTGDGVAVGVAVGVAALSYNTSDRLDRFKTPLGTHWSINPLMPHLCSVPFQPNKDWVKLYNAAIQWFEDNDTK